MKRIVLKFSCLLLLTLGVFALTNDTKAEAFACPGGCPEGTVCERVDSSWQCVCVCFDEYGNCTYSWSYCPTNPWVRK